MKLFKSLKRKVGNAVLPVVGTILGLTILAGSVVSVALNSSKIVYRQNNLEQNNDARQILYLAAKYFCTEINNGKTDSQIREELQEIFGPGLKVTKDTTNPEKYYIWYPNRFTNPSQKEFDPSLDNSQVAEWLKATIVKSEQADDDGDHGTTGINDTLFSEEAKLDEKFSVGNMMTVYMTDEGLLPGRSYSINEVSLVESDIDTFDEAFTYMNNTGVLEIDDIVTTLYCYSLLDTTSNPIAYVETPTLNDDGTEKYKYSIIYKTGNLGGNYYWQDKDNSYPTWLYRQEFDQEMLYNLVVYVNDALKNQITADNIVYSYNDINDSHVISTNNGVELGSRFRYSSSRKFALDLADYIFWKNLPRLCMLLDDFKEEIYRDAASKWSGHTTVDYIVEWKDKGVTINTVNASGGYWDWDYTDADIETIFKRLGNKYTDTSGNLSREKIYNALVENRKTHSQASIVYEKYGTVTWENIRDYVCNKHNIWDISQNNSMNYTYYDWRGREKTKKLTWTSKYSTDKMAKAIADYVTKKVVQTFGSSSGRTLWKDGYSAELITEDDASKLFQDFQFQMDGEKVKISYHFNTVISRNNGEIVNFYSDNTNPIVTYYLTVSEFIKEFYDEVAWCLVEEGQVTLTEEEIETITTHTEDELKEALVEPIRYRYLPSDHLIDIVGNNSETPGMKQQAITNKLIEYYFTNSDDEIKDIIGDTTKYKITINSNTYNNYDGIDTKYRILNCLNYVVDFTVEIDTDNDGYYETSANRKISFLIKYETYNGLNNPITTNKQYIEQPNGNLIVDEDGKHVFGLKPIQDETGAQISKSSLENNRAVNVITAIPLTIRNDELYGTHIITIDGKDYTQVNNESSIYNVAKGTNIYYGKDVNGLAKNGAYTQYYDRIGRPTTYGNNAYYIDSIDKYDRSITVKEGATLFIDGNLRLRDDEKLILEKDAMIFINGNFEIEYEYKLVMNYSSSTFRTTYSARQLTSENISYFKQHGVEVKSAANAKILVNGNMTYRGYKAKYATSASGNLGIYNDPYEGNEYDLVYEQYVFDTAFNKPKESPSNCTLKTNNRYNHYSNECKSLLSGIFIVNGDVKFMSWAERGTPNSSREMYLAMYRNMYSNPLVNATFYVDGAFDMRGLYTSGLYDRCRANFIFAKSIIEPKIALNTVLCAGANTQYGAWNDSDGYLFIICEEAVEFSQETFAHVNIFTPFNELVNSIKEHNDSALNFSDYISKGTFITMYPDITIVDEWGLPSILRSGLKQLYDPGDIGAITSEDHVYGDEV